MSFKNVLKSVFSIPMILVYLLVYTFRFQIAIFLMTAYSHYVDYGKAFTQRLIGEFYFAESDRFHKKAKHYFDNSLKLYLARLEQTDNKAERGQIEVLIGSQYECGKGVEQNFLTAQAWYEKAAQNGNPDARLALDKLKENEQTNQLPQCVPLND